MTIDQQPVPAREMGVIVPYSISVEAFRTKPDVVMPHVGLLRVTRNNFIPFYIGNSGFSHGSGYGQLGHLVWLEENTGFDFKTTFENFDRAGRWNTLSFEEQELFAAAFQRVVAHETRIPNFGPEDMESYDKIGQAMKSNVMMIIDPLPEVAEAVESIRKQVKGMTLHELAKKTKALKEAA